MSKLGKVLLFSIVFEITFAALYFGHVADLAMSSLGTHDSTSTINSGSLGSSAFGQFADLLFSNPVALGIIWSVFNALMVFRVAFRSKRQM